MSNTSWYINNLFLLAALVFGCGKVDSTTAFVAMLESSDTTSSIQIDSLRGVFIISDSGCKACNRGFLDFAISKVKSNEAYIIYNAASGLIFDISGLDSDSISSVINGSQLELERFALNEGSYFISLEHGRIDTVMLIDAMSIFSSVDYIKAH